MAPDPDEDRIRRKAHELWEAEGHPHGRDLDHWEQAREIIAIQDSQGSTLLPRDTGAEEPGEAAELTRVYGDVPGLTDQGEHPLTDTSREPEALSPTPVDAMTSEEVKGEAAAAVEHAPKPAAPPERPRGAEKPAAPPPPAATKPVARPEAVRTGKPTPQRKK